MHVYIRAENSNYFQPAALHRRPTSLKQLSFSSPGSLLIFPNSDLLYDSKRLLNPAGVFFLKKIAVSNLGKYMIDVTGRKFNLPQEPQAH